MHLKKLTVRGTKVPVPVPLLDLAEVIEWVDKTLKKKNEVLTKVTVNGGKDLLDLGRVELARIRLDSETQVEVEMDSPHRLALESLSALHDFANAMVFQLHSLGVECWQLPAGVASTSAQARKVKELGDDLELLLDLLVQTEGFVERSHPDVAPVRALGILLRRFHGLLIKARKEQEWQRCSRLLVNFLHPYLRELVRECEALQLRVALGEGSEAIEPVERKA